MVLDGQPCQAEYEYEFVARRSVDPVAERVVVEGTGKMTRLGQTAVFSFFATYQNNEDGTVYAGYEASIPEASFIVPNAPGTLTIGRR